jgi:hypothetical protein
MSSKHLLPNKRDKREECLQPTACNISFELCKEINVQ